MVFFITAFLFVQLGEPFKISMVLLLSSVFISLSFLVKASSFWLMCVVLLIFSSGMMVIIVYASSISKFSGKKMFVNLGLLFPLVFLFLCSGSEAFVEVFSEQFLKEFTSNCSIIFIVVVLIVSIVFMMENCFSFMFPIQSGF